MPLISFTGVEVACLSDRCESLGTKVPGRTWIHEFLEAQMTARVSPVGNVVWLHAVYLFNEGILCDSKSSLFAHRFRIVLRLCRLRRTRP